MRTDYPSRRDYDSYDEWVDAIDAYEVAQDDRDDDYLEMRMEERNGRD